jgi:prepilin-type N-terminal cleavage/methylation domain-containing protein
MKSNRGFTVVEVLVVIGVIALLTIIIYPSLSDIRKKNRDAERVSDIAAIQLGLSLYKNQNGGAYPKDISKNNTSFTPKYVTLETLTTPDGGEYLYVPLARIVSPDVCTYYHLGIELELPSGQIDTADNFDSSDKNAVTNNYVWCNNFSGPGIAPSNLNYNVRP